MEQSTLNVAAVVQKNETMNSFDNYEGPFHVKKTIIGTNCLLMKWKQRNCRKEILVSYLMMTFLHNITGRTASKDTVTCLQTMDT